MSPVLPASIAYFLAEGSRKKGVKGILADSKKKYLWSLGEAVKTCNLQIDRFNKHLLGFKSGCSEENEARLIAERAQLEETRQDLQKRIWFEKKDPNSGRPPDLLAVSKQMLALQAAESELSVSSNERTLLTESSEYKEALAELEESYPSSKDE